MKSRVLAISVATAIAFGAAPVLADHNSKNGEGWANMPNDIHNTRIETKESGDNEAFRDFVKYGEGADSVNRFADDDTTGNGAMEQKGAAQGAQSQQMGGAETKSQTKQMGGAETQTQTKQMGGAETKTQTKLMDGTQTNSRINEQRRIRTDTATGSASRQRSSKQGSGSPRGGGRR